MSITATASVAGDVSVYVDGLLRTVITLAQAWPVARMVAAYIGAAPDPAFPRGFDADVAVVGVLNRTVTYMEASNLATNTTTRTDVGNTGCAPTPPQPPSIAPPAPATPPLLANAPPTMAGRAWVYVGRYTDNNARAMPYLWNNGNFTQQGIDASVITPAACQTQAFARGFDVIGAQSGGQCFACLSCDYAIYGRVQGPVPCTDCTNFGSWTNDVWVLTGPPPNPPPPLPLAAYMATLIVPPSCSTAAGAPLHRWLPRNARGRAWMDDPPPGGASWNLQLPPGARPDMSGMPATLALAAGGASAGRRYFASPFMVFARVLVAGSTSIFSSSGDDGSYIGVTIDAAMSLHVETHAPGGGSVLVLSTMGVSQSWLNLVVCVSTNGVSVFMDGTSIRLTPPTSYAAAGNFSVPTWRSFSIGSGAVTFQDVRLYIGGSIDCPAMLGDATTCASVPMQRLQPTPSTGVAPPTLPGTVRGGPAHWWSAATQPGAWGVADLLLDTGTVGGAPADASSLQLVPAVL